MKPRTLHDAPRLIPRPSRFDRARVLDVIHLDLDRALPVCELPRAPSNYELVLGLEGTD